MRYHEVFLFLSLCSLIVFGENQQFEYECNILDKLDNLEKDLKETMEAQTVLQSKLDFANEAIESLTKRMKDMAPSGSTYIRWGRTTCPGNGTELVYWGYAGGSHYNEAGGAAEYICLPNSPTYGAYFEDAEQSNGNNIYGAEYEFTDRNNRMKFFDIPSTPDLLDNDAPCAVCKTVRSTTLMVPAQIGCMDGWTLEYNGLLVSGHYAHASASEFVCLDAEPKIVTGGSADQNGKLFYFVEGRCGSLPCPPYVNGREIFCAVCSQ